mgnify:CR=1 FL=1
MPQTASTSPNVIVFFTDQQRWDTTGVHGNPLDLTPNFDRMAMEGTHCFHAYSPQPVCGPARACLQTGRYATAVGCWKNGIALPQDAPSLGKAFSAAGYDTAYIGKWHLASDHNAPVPPHERGGYQYWLASNAIEFTSELYDTGVYDNDCKLVRLPGYRVDALTDAAIRYIDAHQTRPFHLFLSFSEPHFHNRTSGHPAPDGYRERYESRWIPPDLMALGGSTHKDIGGYYGMVKRLDEALGRLLDALKSLRLLDNTIVLFTTDHGCHFRTRNSEFKRSCHDASIRIPMALRGPGFDGGGRVQQMVSLVDVAPTLLDAAGLPIPEGTHGRSILPLIRRERSEWPQEVFVQISEAVVGRAVRTKKWKYSVEAPGIQGWSAPASPRYVETHLYDLENDPHELSNLIGLESHAGVCDVMRGRLIRRMIEAGEPTPIIEPAKPRKAGQRRVLESEIAL